MDKSGDSQTSDNRTDDPALGGIFFKQLMEIYIAPAIERRQSTGELPRPLQLRAAQLICYADERPNVVRLNEEVQAIAKVKLREGKAKAMGQVVFEDEVEGYETVALPESEDPNCGHATMLLLNGRWFVVFDFRYNRGKASIVVERAREFMWLAEQARAREAWSSMTYVLFSAAESAARAQLLLVPNQKFERSKTHDTVQRTFNAWARLGNVDRGHSDALNRLARLRPKAGHGLERFSLPSTEADQLLDAVREMIVRAEERLAAPR